MNNTHHTIEGEIIMAVNNNIRMFLEKRAISSVSNTIWWSARYGTRNTIRYASGFLEYKWHVEDMVATDIER